MTVARHRPVLRDALAGRISMISYGLHRYVLPAADETRSGLRLRCRRAAGSGRSSTRTVIGTVTTLEDISDRLASEAELRKQIEVQKMARVTAEKAVRAKDEFLSTVSHEIRNPLNAVLGWTRILIDRVDVEPEMLDAGAARHRSQCDRSGADDRRSPRCGAHRVRQASAGDAAGRSAGVMLAAVDVVMPAATAKQISDVAL